MLSAIQSSLKKETPIDLELLDNPLYFEPYLKEYDPELRLPDLENEDLFFVNEEFPLDKTMPLYNRISYSNKKKNESLDVEIPAVPLIQFTPPLYIQYEAPKTLYCPVKDIEQQTITHSIQSLHVDTNQTSLSTNRAIGDQSDYIRGNSTALPFMPGGMENKVKERFIAHPRSNELETIAPGLPYGLQVDAPHQSILHQTLNQLTINPSKPPLNKQADTVDGLVDEMDQFLQINEPEIQREYAIHVSNDPIDLTFTLAKEWPFELDIFQKQAIFHLEQGHNVFIAAHTSAGKTVIAEYAIALANLHHTKCIYTSPIKALSNQKYRDFKHIFPSVGIVTGDVQIDPNSNCIIMTTEILRSMLYRGADVLRELEYVIFDEIHYLNDIERGVCWEEVIVLLPSHVKIIMLSATVPNTKEFCEWVGRTKLKDIYIITTYKRPVPLEFNLFMNQSKKFFTVKDIDAQEINKINWKQASDLFYANSKKTASSKDMKEKQMITNCIYKLQKDQNLPCIFFCFSRRKTEFYSDLPMTLTTKSQQNHIHTFFSKSILRLSKQDQLLPQIQSTYQLLIKGIGLHHSGMLPLLKEIVEMLFCQGYIYCLFATETFAMGINAPAKSVCFTSVRKFDGKVYREINNSEFIQMSGRAGRRNKDTKGLVIIMCIDYLPNVNWLHTMLLSSTNQLASQFRLTYNMIIQMTRLPLLTMMDMMQSSFLENKSIVNKPVLEEELALKTKALDLIPAITQNPFNVDLLPYCQTLLKKHGSMIKCYTYLWQSKRGFYPIGQLLLTIKGLGIIVNYENGQLLVALVPCEVSAFDIYHQQVNTSTMNRSVAQCELVMMPLSNIVCLYEHVEKLQRMTALSKVNNKLLSSVLSKCLLHLQQGKIHQKLPKLKEIEYMEHFQIIMDAKRQLNSYKCSKGPTFKEDCQFQLESLLLKQEIQFLSNQLESSSVFHLEEYTNRVKVLQELKYIQGNTILLKGRVMAEINTMDSLIVTELLFMNFFDNLECNELLSLLSTLIYQEKSQDEIVLTSQLTNQFTVFKEHIERLLAIQQQLRLDVLEMSDIIKPGLMEVVYEWANQMSFVRVMDLTSTHEGSIVRCITRLDEGCREMRGASRLMGNLKLVEKMEKCQMLIRRDIVFAASLYL